MQYQVHYESGGFAGPSGADKLSLLLTAYSGKGAWEVVSVFPVSKDGKTSGVQIVLRSAG